MEQVVGEMMGNFLPTSQEFIMRNMQLLAHPHKSVQVLLHRDASDQLPPASFLPLEVALNQVWGVRRKPLLSAQPDRLASPLPFRARRGWP